MGNDVGLSPIAKISGWPGTDRSEFTMILPDLSVAEFIHRPAGEARTPAPQSTVAAGTRWPLAIIPSASMLVTRVLVQTLTPNCLNGAEPWPRGPQDTTEAHAAPFHTAESAQTSHRYDESHVPEPCATFLPACWPSPLPPYLRQRVRT